MASENSYAITNFCDKTHHGQSARLSNQINGRYEHEIDGKFHKQRHKMAAAAS